MKTVRKAVLSVLCVALVIVASITGTLAYLTDDDAVTNTFTVGNVRIDLDEAKVDENGKALADGSRTQETDTAPEGNAYHLLPGLTYDKDPRVTVTKGSEDSYVRMIVTVDGLDDLKAALPRTKTVTDAEGSQTEEVVAANSIFYSDEATGYVFLLQNLCVDDNGDLTWDKDTWLFEGFTQNADGTQGYYEFRYVGNAKDDNGEALNNGIVVKDKDNDTVLPDLFEKITVPGTVDNAHLANLANVKIVVTADAIQAAGFTASSDGSVTAEDAAWAAFDAQKTTNS